jgi:dUTP pyrophosphatase
MKRTAYISINVNVDLEEEDDVMSLQEVNEVQKALGDGYKEWLEKKHAGDAGLDLFLINNSVLDKQMMLLDLGFKMVIIDEYTHTDGIMVTKTPIPYMLVPRSSTHKLGFIQANSIGIIDAGYRGDIKVPTLCIEYPPIALEGMKRIVQAVPFDGKGVDDVIVLDVNTDLEAMFPSTRGAGGFGSTGS